MSSSNNYVEVHWDDRPYRHSLVQFLHRSRVSCVGTDEKYVALSDLHEHQMYLSCNLRHKKAFWGHEAGHLYLDRMAATPRSLAREEAYADAIAYMLCGKKELLAGIDWAQRTFRKQVTDVNKMDAWMEARKALVEKLDAAFTEYENVAKKALKA